MQAMTNPLAAFYRVEQPAYFELQGQDRIDFIQRQSTNDLRGLQTGQVLATVLTSPTGRIVDLLQVLAQPEQLELVALPGFGPATLQFLRKRIFFNDRVSLKDRSDAYFQLRFYGQELAQVLAALGLEPVVTGQVNRAEMAGQELRAWRAAGLGAAPVNLLGPLELLPTVAQILQQSGLRQMDTETHEIERIRLGLPAAGQELSEAYTPLEVGLAGLVAENKGCYTGQEVLARQLTYDKVTRALVRLKLSEPVPVGSPVWSAGRAIGEITSVSPLTNAALLALAVLKKPHHAPGSRVVVGAGDSRTRAEVWPG